MARHSSLNIENDVLVVSTPYNQELVEAIKSLPTTERKFDPSRKVWRVEAKHGPSVAAWIRNYIGDDVEIPPMPSRGAIRIKQKLTVTYVSTCKARSDGSSSAYGRLAREWGVIFPEQVLRDFFDGSRAAPGLGTSYFGLLGVSKSCSQDELSAGFRRMAKLWHPDVCKDEAATDIFIRIKAAYDVLKDPEMRARYEAGLVLEAMMGRQAKPGTFDLPYGYRSPLRSGIIFVEGTKKLDMIEVEKIFTWEDIVDNQGRTLIVSWPKGAKEPVEEWL